MGRPLRVLPTARPGRGWVETVFGAKGKLRMEEFRKHLGRDIKMITWTIQGVPNGSL